MTGRRELKLYLELDDHVDDADRLRAHALAWVREHLTKYPEALREAVREAATDPVSALELTIDPDRLIEGLTQGFQNARSRQTEENRT